MLLIDVNMTLQCDWCGLIIYAHFSSTLGVTDTDIKNALPSDWTQVGIGTYCPKCVKDPARINRPEKKSNGLVVKTNPARATRGAGRDLRAVDGKLTC